MQERGKTLLPIYIKVGSTCSTYATARSTDDYNLTDCKGKPVPSTSLRVIRDFYPAAAASFLQHTTTSSATLLTHEGGNLSFDSASSRSVVFPSIYFIMLELVFFWEGVHETCYSIKAAIFREHHSEYGRSPGITKKNRKQKRIEKRLPR